MGADGDGLGFGGNVALRGTSRAAALKGGATDTIGVR